MFVQLSGEWFLNLDHVTEVRFAGVEGDRRATLSSWQVDEDGETRLMTWGIDGEEADRLHAAMRENQIPRGRRPGDMVL